jgi:inositol hexakisphosphate/diphosphoinositol-pentakisphosphate kinase
MRELVQQLERRNVRVERFGDTCIFEQDVKNWPYFPHLLCFHSNGFPIHRAIRYIEATNPKLINDVTIQSDVLLSRNKVYEKLKEIGVPHPKYIVVERDDQGLLGDTEFVQEADCIKV